MKNLIILPDGTEIYSGDFRGNNLRSATLKQCVNSETELTLGSVCAAILECKLQTPNGALNIAAGTEITLYKVDDSGTRHKVGLFTLEKPTRPSAHTYKLTAYDRISWLDKDLTEWLSALDGWPYSVFDFAHMVAAQCGLVLKSTSLLNGDYQIRKFSGQGITGRRLMEWIGQICAKFCRATPDGEIEFAWYSENPIEINSSGDNYYFQGSLTYEDYQTAPIEKVQIRLTEDDVGAVWPQEAGEKNTYIITGNYLLTTDDPQGLQSIAEGIYGAISNVRYTPCEVSLRANLDIAAGDIVNITDRNGKTITCYIMTMTTKGQRATLECTGSPRRDCSTVVNNETLKSLSGKMLEVRKSIDGLNIKATQLDDKIEKSVAEVNIKADGISAEVSKQAYSMGQVKDDIASLSLEAQGVSIQVQKIIDDGVSKVSTGMGYTFDDEGLKIQKPGEAMLNKLDDTGMEVSRSGEVMLRADKDGVLATDVTVRNFLIVGDHARFEDYSNGRDTKRTACFYI